MSKKILFAVIATMAFALDGAVAQVNVECSKYAPYSPSYNACMSGNSAPPQGNLFTGPNGGPPLSGVPYQPQTICRRQFDGSVVCSRQ